MKRLSIYLILSVVLLQMNGALVSLALFTCNQHAIAERECERRTPNCCGKCYLAKNLAKQDEGSSQAGNSNQKISIVEPIIEAIVHERFTPTIHEQKGVSYISCFANILAGYLVLPELPPRFV